MEKFREGDDIYWWCDHDPGDAAVGPKPNIYPEYGKFVRHGMGTIIVSVENWPAGASIERKISPSWLLTEEEIGQMKAQQESFMKGDPPWMTAAEAKPNGR